MIVLTLVLISTVSVFAVDDVERRTPLKPSLDMLDEVATFEIVIPHPANYGREKVLIWLAIGVGIGLYFIFFGLSKKFLERVLGDTESVHKGLAIGLTLTSIFAAPVIEMIAGLVAFFFGMTAIVGLFAIVVVVVLMLLALKGVWAKNRGAIMTMEAEGLELMDSARNTINASVKNLRDNAFLNDDPSGMLTEGASKIHDLNAHNIRPNLSAYTKALTTVIRNIPRFDVSHPNFKAIQNLFGTSTEGKQVLENAEHKLSDIQTEFKQNEDNIAEIQNIDQMITTIQNTLAANDFDPTQITRFNSQISKLQNTRKSFAQFFEALIASTKFKVRKLVVNAKPAAINALHKEVAGNLRTAEQREKQVEEAIKKALESTQKIDQENKEKRDNLFEVVKEFFERSQRQHGGRLGTTLKADYNYDLKQAQRANIKVTQPNNNAMQFSPFQLTCKLTSEEVKGIKNQLSTKASTLTDDQITTLLKWVTDNYKETII